MRAALTSLLAAITAAGVAQAQADDFPTVALSWVAPEECAPSAEIAAAVSTSLGRAAFTGAGTAELDIRVELVRAAEEGTFEAELLMRDATGRVLGRRALRSEGADCRTLDEPLTVVLAMMLNVRRADLDLPEPAPPQAPAPSAAGPRFIVEAAAGLVLGLLPQPALEVALALALTLTEGVALGLELAFDWAPGVEAAEGSLTIGASAARALLVLTPVRGDVELSVPIRVGAGPMWAEASGFDENLGGVLGFLDVRAGLALGFRLGGSLRATLAASAGLVAVRPTFLLQESAATSPLFTPELVSGSFAAGLAWRPL